MRQNRRIVLGATLLALAVVLGACGSGGDDTEPRDGEEKGTLTVGVSAAFAENQIVAEMYAQVLENAGYTVNRQMSIESREISDPALESGDMDIKPEYLGSELLFLDPEAEASGDPEENVALLEPLLEEKGITLLEPSAANDTNALVVKPETAEEFDLTTVSDLAAVDDQLTLGAPPECATRPFCAIGLKDVYGVEFAEIKTLDVGGPLTVEALEADEIDVALLFSTSSVIGDKGWVVLEDDMHLQTAENITPVVRTEVLTDEIESLLNEVSAKLTTENMTELNGRVEIDQEDPADVAREFLEEEGLL